MRMFSCLSADIMGLDDERGISETCSFCWTIVEQAVLFLLSVVTLMLRLG